MKNQLAKMAFVYLLICVPVQRNGDYLTKIRTCSRPHSSIVRQLLHKLWRPVFKRHNVKMPKECPFHMARDIYGPQELAKIYYRSNLWTCHLCGKTFYKHIFLDLHMAGKHPDAIVTDDSAVCLADYCDIFRCHGYLPSNDSVPSPFDLDLETFEDMSAYEAIYPDLGVPLPASSVQNALIPAPPSELLELLELSELPDREHLFGAGNKDKDKDTAKDKEVLGEPKQSSKRHTNGDEAEEPKTMTRQRRENNGHNTIPKEGVGREERTVGGEELLEKAPKARRKDTKKRSIRDEIRGFFHSDPTVAALDDAGAADGVFIVNGDDADLDGESSAWRAEDLTWKQPEWSSRQECQQQEMDELRERCEATLYNCLSPLKLMLADSEYRIMEDKLHSQLCSYLSCDRYWLFYSPSSPSDSRRKLKDVTARLFLLILACLFTFLGLTYYLVWFCF